MIDEFGAVDILWDRSVERGRSCFVPDLRGKVFSLLPICVMLCVGFYWRSFIRFIKCSYSKFAEDFFFMSGIEFCQRLFLSASLKSCIVFLFFCLYGP